MGSTLDGAAQTPTQEGERKALARLEEPLLLHSHGAQFFPRHLCLLLVLRLGDWRQVCCVEEL